MVEQAPDKSLKIWLKDIGLGNKADNYGDLFAKQEYNSLDEMLRYPPTEAHLEKIGISAQKDRKQILAAIEEEKKKQQPQEMKFSVNSAILPGDRYFLLDPLPWIKESFLPKLNNSVYCLMFVSLRANGKTTTNIFTQRYLSQYPQYLAVFLTFELFSMSSVKLFWTKLSSELSYLSRISVSFDSKEGFSEAFRTNGPFSGRKVVIFIDEFDLIMKDENIKDEFLSTLRGMKSMRNEFTLECLIAIGTFSLLVLESDSKVKTIQSPFNARDTINFPFFSFEQTQQLFGLFMSARHETMNEKIIQDIYMRTRGHRGLTCLLGKLLDEEFRFDGNLPSIVNWKSLMLEKLGNQVMMYPTLERMVQTLLKNNDLANSARKFLYCKLLPFRNFNYVTCEEREHGLCKFLRSEGVLISPEPETFQISSPLIRDVNGSF